MRDLLRRAFAGDTVKKIIRVYLIAFLALFVPGLLGWLNDLTAWASSNGQRPFPDAHNLSYLLVSVVAAGTISAVHIVVLVLENLTGKGVLRTPPTADNPPPARPARGAASVPLTAGAALVLGLVLAVTVVLLL